MTNGVLESYKASKTGGDIPANTFVEIAQQTQDSTSSPITLKSNTESVNGTSGSPDSACMLLDGRLMNFFSYDSTYYVDVLEAIQGKPNKRIRSKTSIDKDMILSMIPLSNSKVIVIHKDDTESKIKASRLTINENSITDGGQSFDMQIPQDTSLGGIGVAEDTFLLYEIRAVNTQYSFSVALYKLTETELVFTSEKNIVSLTDFDKNPSAQMIWQNGEIKLIFSDGISIYSSTIELEGNILNNSTYVKADTVNNVTYIYKAIPIDENRVLISHCSASSGIMISVYRITETSVTRLSYLNLVDESKNILPEYYDFVKIREKDYMFFYANQEGDIYGLLVKFDGNVLIDALAQSENMDGMGKIIAYDNYNNVLKAFWIGKEGGIDVMLMANHDTVGVRLLAIEVGELENVIIQSVTRIDGITKTALTPEQPGDVWLLAPPTE